MEKNLSVLPEVTAKKFEYCGPVGHHRFIHKHQEFNLSQVTPEKAAELIEQGFEYLKPIGKKETPDNNPKP